MMIGDDELLMALDDHVAAVARAMAQFAGPRAFLRQHSLELLPWNRMHGSEQVMGIASDRFVARVAIEAFASGVPFGNAGYELPHEDRVLRELDQPALSLHGRFHRAPVGDIVQRDADAVGETAVVAGRLHDVVRDVQTEGGRRDLFASGIREHDHRQVSGHRVDRFQHLEAVGPSQLKVGDDDVEGRIAERRIQLLLADDLRQLEVGEFSRQRAPRQQAILGIVVDQKHASRHG